jgi:hypothetical protein
VQVLFRFALAVLKLCEPALLNCRSVGAVHACLSKVGDHVKDYKTLAHVAFVELNPFPLKAIETKRQTYLNQLRVNGGIYTQLPHLIHIISCIFRHHRNYNRSHSSSCEHYFTFYTKSLQFPIFKTRLLLPISRLSVS